MSLRALNLSNCLIGSLHTLARSPLPAITVLNLRGNRLASLAGIEKLLSLERLDLRENKLRDPTELARLTGMPEFRDLYISRNTFAKTHPNHRVTIFNLFRRTPGYTDDITIDSSSPSYSERRQLVDRIPESANVPVVKPPLDDDDDDIDDTATLPAEPRESTTSANSGTKEVLVTPQIPADDDGTKSHRRRKAPRRRVVDMAQDTSPRTPGTGSPEALFVTALQSPRTARAQQGPPSPEDSPSAPRQARKSEPDETCSLKSSALPINPGQPDSNKRGEEAARLAALTMSNEQYRQKIEALKKEYGNGWLSALDDDTWAGNPVGIPTDFKERDGTPSSKVSLAKT